MPHYFAAEKVARAIVSAKRQADDKFHEGLADPLVAYFINQLWPDHQHSNPVLGGNQT